MTPRELLDEAGLVPEVEGITRLMNVNRRDELLSRSASQPVSALSSASFTTSASRSILSNQFSRLDPPGLHWFQGHV